MKGNKLSNNYRYEKKIPLSQEDLQKFWFWFKHYGANFRQVYPERTVNNIYFDSPLFKNYFDKEDGVSFRAKARLRWYYSNVIKDKITAYGPVSCLITQPDNFRFEVKVRSNAVGYKHVQTITGTDLELQPLRTLYSRLRKVLTPKYKVVLDDSHMPAVFNSYVREYYSTREGIRLTIDKNNQYALLASHKNLPKKLTRSKMAAVIELKYTEDQLNLTNELFKNFPFKTYKNSKYVDALECTSLR